MRKSLSAARAGHEGLLAGFGLERYIVYGLAAPPNSRQWEDRLSLTGAGEGRFHSLRSITDNGGNAFGYFQRALPREELKEVIGLVDDVGLLDVAPFRIEPADMLIRVTIIVGGMQVTKFVGVNDPERLSPLQPLFRKLQEIELRLKETPSRSLSIEMTTVTEAVVGNQTIPVSVRFVNRGRESYWINHPRTLGRGAYTDRCTIEYGYRAPIQPGITPLPLEVMETSLRSETETGLQMVWMAAGTVQEARLVADVNFHRPGEFLARAVFSNYDGEDVVGGVPRLRGCGFSTEQTIQVRE